MEPTQVAAQGAGGSGSSDRGGAASADRGASERSGRSDGRDGPAGRSDIGATASSLGALNAANASATARENASIDSVVGQLNGYESALRAGDMPSAAVFLASAASQPVTPELVEQVNTKLGFTIDAASADALATLAREQQ